MQNGPRTNTTFYQQRPAAPFAVPSTRWSPGASRPEPKHSQDAKKNYHRYLELARTETLNGNTVGAENYYQYAEHYYRSMSSDLKGT